MNGVIAPKSYGLQDHREMFAVQSVAFLRGYNDYYPFTRRSDSNLILKNAYNIYLAI